MDEQTDNEINELLKKIKDGRIIEKDSSTDSVGKDLQLISKELTDDRNVHRFSNYSKLDSPTCALMLTMADKPKWGKEMRGRYQVLSGFMFYNSLLKQAIKSGMADRYKDQSGYLLAFRGGIEWRQAGILGADMQNMDEQKAGLMNRMRRG